MCKLRAIPEKPEDRLGVISPKGSFLKKVGATGFEPVTSCTPSYSIAFSLLDLKR
jgi:hypothetical protein